jgi:electron transport complex protein RnfC
LLPQQLFWHAKAKELDKAQDYNLFDCIECGACAYVCPSEIPLVHYYRIAKSEIRVEQEEKQKSDKARDRFEKREARLIAEQQARDEKHRLAAQARKQAMESNGNNAKDKIAAALARAKAKKQASIEVTAKPIEPTEAQPADGPQPPSMLQTTAASTNIASSNQRVQAAIARAKAKKATIEATSRKPEIVRTNEASDAKENNIEEKQQEPTETYQKQAKITTAVAKAKAKREIQRIATDQYTPNQTKNQELAEKVSSIETNNPAELIKTEEQDIDMKRRRITAAVAKAKAKKAAHKEAISREDKL